MALRFRTCGPPMSGENPPEKLRVMKVVRVRRGELDTIQRAARAANVPAATYMRRAAVERATRDLGDPRASR